MQRLLFYTTAGCHLCEQAEAMLGYLSGRPDLGIETIDVAESPELVERYGERIPVVRCEEKGSELNWPFEFSDLLAMLS